MRRLRTPPPNAHLSRIERCGSQDLLRFFESALKARPGVSEYSLLAPAWGKLFSDLFLSAEELIDEMERGGRRFRDDHEQMLREFIRADCASGGVFVLDVIRNGGKIDRAALFMIADPEDLAGIEQNGIMALQLLIEACDPKSRPALIRRVGKHHLAQIHDRRGLPLIFSIFGLCDLGMSDLDAIDAVFTREELRHIMSRSRTGKNALEVFTGIEASMKRYPSYERNAVMVRNAFVIPVAKDTQTDEPERPVRIRTISPSQAKKDTP